MKQASILDAEGSRNGIMHAKNGYLWTRWGSDRAFRREIGRKRPKTTLMQCYCGARAKEGENKLLIAQTKLLTPKCAGVAKWF